MSKAQKNAQECRELCEEIAFLQKHLNWTERELCEKTRVELHPNCDLDSDKKETERWYQRIKKALLRANWDSGKVHETTLKTLTDLRRGIFLTDDYRESELYESNLPPTLRKDMNKISKKLDKWAKEINDDEE